MRIRTADLVSVRHFVEEQGLEQKVAGVLNPEEWELFNTVQVDDWIPVTLQASIYTKIAQLAYPEDHEPIYKLHLVVAEKCYSSIYKILLKIKKLDDMLDHGPEIWSYHYEQGEPEVKRISPNEVDFLVKNYPALPIESIEVTRAHIHILIAATGKKEITVKPDTSNPQCWRWQVQWQK